jgi:hypothetical protein
MLVMIVTGRLRAELLLSVGSSPLTIPNPDRPPLRGGGGVISGGKAVLVCLGFVVGQIVARVLDRLSASQAFLILSRVAKSNGLSHHNITLSQWGHNLESLLLEHRDGSAVFCLSSPAPKGLALIFESRRS